MKQGLSFFVTGTDTGVGKTMVTGCLTAFLSMCGYDAVPYKPIQSGGVQGDGGLVAEDVTFYRSLHSLPYEQNTLCTYCMEPAVSPHLAARQTGTRINPGHIAQQLSTLRKKHDVVLVEGAGGLAVPIMEEKQEVYMTADLIRDLRLPLLIVTHPGLGTINHTILTVEYARACRIPILGLLVNRMPDNPSEMMQDNVRIISSLTNLPVLGMLPDITDFKPERIRERLPEIGRSLRLTLLLERLRRAEIIVSQSSQ
ncbi:MULTISPECIES: dethiobiotin synthase [Aneurinibacillus]|nr:MULTISPECIES: dethiobiotin synthase [Aneurinibacillus]AMA73509.1 hypothetical protein ACH33_12020 [Aneurinibacillus sp. XH2]MED0680025.1 dethiobiotin synthase [Aneurinibacillus thermoaerophilus]MED0738458.1 dethiobiotin synthase [Aneurinibacillus thermoaerophilus]SDH19454.1 dethiobiotin synthetase [Aneurinibacillus thermoaerophilus]